MSSGYLDRRYDSQHCSCFTGSTSSLVFSCSVVINQTNCVARYAVFPCAPPLRRADQRCGFPQVRTTSSKSPSCFCAEELGSSSKGHGHAMASRSSCRTAEAESLGSLKQAPCCKCTVLQKAVRNLKKRSMKCCEGINWCPAETHGSCKFNWKLNYTDG